MTYDKWRGSMLVMASVLEAYGDKAEELRQEMPAQDWRMYGITSNLRGFAAQLHEIVDQFDAIQSWEKQD